MSDSESRDAENAEAEAAPESADYEVGYGKPPKKTRFRKGTSGNPKGRPKGARGFQTILREAIYKPIAVRQGDRIRTVPKVEALIESMLARALTGDHRALHEILAKICELADDDYPGDGGDEKLNEDDQEIIAGIRERWMRSLNAAGERADGPRAQNEAGEGDVEEEEKCSR